MRGQARHRSVGRAVWLALVACGTRDEPPAPVAAPSVTDAAAPVDAAPLDAAPALDAGDLDGGGLGLEGFGPGSGPPGVGIGIGRPARGTVAKVRLTVTTATGGLGRDVVRRTLQRYRGRFTYCYEKALLLDDSLDGTIVLTFTIGADGKVADARASGLSPTASECMASAVGDATFPTAKAGAATAVTTRLDCSYAGRP